MLQNVVISNTKIHNAVQSAFCHPESLCRMIYAKLKTIPEGIRK